MGYVVTTVELERLIQNKFNLRLGDELHKKEFFEAFIEETTFYYQGFINLILVRLFPGLEDNIE